MGLLGVSPQQLGDLNLTGRALNLAMLFRVVEWSQAPKRSWVPSRASPRFCWDTGNVPVPFVGTTVITPKESVRREAWFYI